MEFLPGRPDVHGSDQSRGRKYSLSFTSCHGTLFLLSLSDVCTILGLTLFSVARPPSFLEQGTIIWHLTPGSEWLNGWFLAVSAVTGSVRLTLLYTHTTLQATPHASDSHYLTSYATRIRFTSYATRIRCGVTPPESYARV